MVTAPSKRERTRALLQQCALDLFERQGFDETTVGQVAEAAGVTPMTFFRHFSTKARALLDDPYDPLIRDAVAAQPRSAAPLDRTVKALRHAWRALPEPAGEVQRRRIRVVAATPSLWGEMHASNRTTEDLIVAQLVDDGADVVAARAAAAAVLAAVTAALFEWARQADTGLGAAVERSLRVMEGGR
jgi:AcrR family transcriptional regulator